MIFNIIVDCVLCAWDVAMPGDRASLFYADDGVLYGNNGPELQRNLDFFSESFAAVGLKMNAKKTEAMIMTGHREKLHYSEKAYCRLVTGKGLTWKERQAAKIHCELCGKNLSLRAPIDNFVQKRVKNICANRDG